MLLIGMEDIYDSCITKENNTFKLKFMRILESGRRRRNEKFFSVILSICVFDYYDTCSWYFGFDWQSKSKASI